MGIKTVERYGDTLAEKLYIPAIAKGLAVTFGHFAKNIANPTSIPTKQYPLEQPQDITDRYRGRHRLTKRSDDSVACVACFMCATACPADCIFIEATERTDGVDEKMPAKFNIDLLECIYCGYCVEACPCDAIRMDTGIFSVIGKKREDFIITKEELLATPGAFGKENSLAH